MALQDSTIPIDFGQGVDTKTDPKQVVAGKFIELRDGVFTSPKRISKRNGYTTIGTTVVSGSAMSSPKLTHAYNNELLSVDSGYLLSYSSNQDAWLRRGNYSSLELTKTPVDQNALASASQGYVSSGYVDCAILGNYALYSWSTAIQSDSSSTLVSSQAYGLVVDLSTGTTLLGPTALTGAIAAVNVVKSVLLGSTVLGVIYQDSSTNELKCKTVNFAGSGVVSFNAATTISSGYSKTTFDIVNTTGGAAIVYPYGSFTGIKVTTIDTTGTIVASDSIVDSAAVGPYFISVNTNNNNLWVYWVDTTYSGDDPSAGTINFSVYTSAVVSVRAPTLLVTIADPFLCTNMTSYTTSSTAQTLVYGIFVTNGGNFFVDQSKQISAPSSGSVGSITSFAYGVTPFSHPILMGSDYFAIFVSRGGLANSGAPGTQTTYFLIRLTNIPSDSSIPYVAARFGYGQGNSQASRGSFGTVAPVSPAKIRGGIIGYNAAISLFSSTKIIYACSIETQAFLSDFFTSLTGAPGGLSGAYSFMIDFNGANAYRAHNSGQLAVLNGAIMQAYDGKSCTEFGFHAAPEMTDYSLSLTSGSIAAGTYGYLAIFQWIDAQGNLHESAPSEAVSVSVGGSSNAIDLAVTNPYLSQKTGVNVAIYRTTAGGSIYYLITDPVFTLNSTATSSGVVTYLDKLADADIIGKPQSYTNPGSAVLDNSVPPPSMAMVAHNNRLWFVDSENPNIYWYTKSFSSGTGLSPSAFLTQEIDPKFGNITALAEMDEKIVIFKAQGICYQSGDGADDTGNNSTLSTPQFVPSDVGCDQLKSVVSTPFGVMFHSANGLYLFDRSTGVSYVGMDVEAYNSQTITSAVFITGKSQIRFLVSSGSTLLYDYIFKQWSTFTNHTGVSSTIWNGSYVYARSSGALYKESPTVYTDNATSYSLYGRTSWLHLGIVQGFQRVRWLEMLGDYANGNSATHGIQIQAAYDFSSTLSSAIPYTFGAINTSGPFQYGERLPIQKCDSIQLVIQEITTAGNATEYIDLTNIAFEAGIKTGLNKLPAGQTVG